MSQSMYAQEFESPRDTASYYGSPSANLGTTYPSPPPISALPVPRSPSLTSSSSMSQSTSSAHSPVPASTPLPYSLYDADRSHKMPSGFPHDGPSHFHHDVHVADYDHYDQGYPRMYTSPHDMYSATSGPILDRFTRHSELNPYYTTSPLLPSRSLTHPSLSDYGHSRPHPYARIVPSHMTVPSQAYPVVYTDNASVKLTDRIRRKCHNCQSTATSTWRRSSLSPGKVLCNKCGLFERTHSVARPKNKLPKGALSAGR